MNQQIVEKYFQKALIHTGSKVDYREIYNGTFNEVYRIETEYGSYIWKQALHELKSDRFRGIRMDPCKRMEIESRTAQIYADILHGNHIPKILCYDPTNSIIIMDLIDGVLWREQLKNEEFIPSVLVELGSIIGRLHANTYHKYSEDKILVNEDAWKAELQYHFYNLLPAVDSKTAQIIRQMASEHLQDKSVLLHGDLVTRNVIVDKQGVIFLIDFELSRLGMPSYDIGHLFGDFILFMGYCPKHRVAVLNALKDFLDKYFEEFTTERELFKRKLLRDLGVAVLSRLSGAALQADFLKSEEAYRKMNMVGHILINEKVDFQDIEQLY